MEIGSPVYTQLGVYLSFQMIYFGSAHANVTGIVFMVIHNFRGQTVEFSTATLQIAPSANRTVYPITTGLAPGTYSAIFFVSSTSGTAISTATTKTFTI
jgi:hypothetical protein